MGLFLQVSQILPDGLKWPQINSDNCCSVLKQTVSRCFSTRFTRADETDPPTLPTQDRPPSPLSVCTKWWLAKWDHQPCLLSQPFYHHNPPAHQEDNHRNDVTLSTRAIWPWSASVQFIEQLLAHLIWRANIKRNMDKYESFSRGKYDNKSETNMIKI